MASGLAVALVTVPGLAQAAPVEPSAPLDALSGALDGSSGSDVAENSISDVAENGGGTEVEQDGGTGGDDIVGDIVGEIGGGAGDGGADGDTGDTGDDSDDSDAGELPAPPRLEAPDELLEALKQATRAAGIPDSCVDGIADGFELIVNGLLDPAQLEAIIDELTGLLEEFEGGLDGVTGGSGGMPDLGLLAAGAESMDEDVAPEEDPGGDVVAGLELIGTTLAEDCMPEMDEGETPTVPVDNGTDVPPAEHPAPVQQAPVAQPVAYPGYAPTGVETARADDASVPLTALGGGLVLVAAGAAGYGMRGRAVRTRG